MIRALLLIAFFRQLRFQVSTFFRFRLFSSLTQRVLK